MRGGAAFLRGVDASTTYAWPLRLSEWIVDRVDPKPGQTILELTAGPGETGFLAAERLLPGGTLISTDLSVGMVDAARRGAEARGFSHVECRTMDAQAIDLPDASVDGVISRFGLMLLPEPTKAFAEIRRVLRPAGRLVYGVMGPPQENPLLTMFVRAFAEHGHALDADPFAPGGLFSLRRGCRHVCRRTNGAIPEHVPR